MRYLVLVLVCLTGTITIARDGPTLEQRLEDHRLSQIEYNKKQLKELQAGLKKANRYSAAALRRKIAERQSEIRFLQKTEVEHPKNLEFPLSPGMWGRLTDAPQIMQILGEKDAIVRVTQERGVAETRTDPYLFWVWIHGVSTEGLTDQRGWPQVKFKYFEVGEPRTYQTLAGPKTIPVIQPIQ